MPSTSTPVKQGPVPSTVMKRSYYGATYLFDEIGELLGITADLKKPAFLKALNKYSQLLTSWFWKIVIRCFAFQSGIGHIPILTAALFPPKEAVICLHLLRKSLKIVFSACRLNDERRMNIGLKILPVFPPIQRLLSKSNTLSTRTMIRLRRLILLCGLAKNLDYRFTTAS